MISAKEDSTAKCQSLMITMNSANKSIDQVLPRRFFGLFGPIGFLGVLLFAIATGLGGCAVAPKTVLIEDMDKRFAAGTIVSARQHTPVALEALFNDLTSVRVVYVGEIHTNKMHHQHQLEIIKGLFKKNLRLVVGMEMFDHTYQPVLDLWSAGELDEKAFLEKTHWAVNWRYNFGLYRPIFEFVRDNKIPVVALNIPNHIPPKVRVGGLDNLQPEDKAHLPAKIALNDTAHRAYIQKIYKQHLHHQFGGKGNFEYFYMAQSLWEDTMAEAIAQNIGDRTMVVLVGNGHIIRKFGVPNRAYGRKKLPFRTIYQTAVGGKIDLSAADYIWVTP